MKYLKLLILLSITIVINVGCVAAWKQNHAGIQMAADGQYNIIYTFYAPKDELMKATIQALDARHWTVSDIKEDSLNAYVSKRNVFSAIAKIKFSDNRIEIDTNGSIFKEQPCVPVRQLRYLKKTITAALNNENLEEVEED